MSLQVTPEVPTPTLKQVPEASIKTTENTHCCLCQFIGVTEFDLESHIDNNHSDIFRRSIPEEEVTTMEGQNQNQYQNPIQNTEQTQNNIKQITSSYHTKNKRKRQIPQQQQNKAVNQVKIFKCVILGIARTNFANLNYFKCL